MFNTLFTWMNQHPIAATIIALVLLWIMLVAFSEYTDEQWEMIPDNLEEDNMTDIITCSVPWQEIIVFQPNQYSDYNVDYYDGYVDITMKNWNTCFLPIQYTTVIDKSFKSLPQA